MKSRVLQGIAIFVGVLVLFRGATAFMDADTRRHDREEKPRENRLTDTEPVPKECADAVSADTGQPVMLMRIAALTWGVSTRPTPYGEPLPILVWIDNPSDEPQFVASCSGIGGFSEETEVFDSSGRRMLRFEERRRRNPDFGICTSEYPVKIPAHTCPHGTFTDQLSGDGMGSRLKFNLTPTYDLLPGNYILAGRTPKQRNADLEASVPTTVSIDPKAGLPITIEDWGVLDRLFHLSTFVNYGTTHLRDAIK